SKVSMAPIINAGDGKGQHPTQALLDLYTIWKEFGKISGISIAMVGDLLNGRTVRSLSYLIGKFQDVNIYFVSPESIRMRDDIKDYLQRHNVWFTEDIDLRNVVSKVDVVYQTRIQKERGALVTEQEIAAYIIGKKTLKSMKDKAIVMHPLPRVGEILLEVDEDDRAAYFRQAQNGLFVRMALLQMLLGDK
ncbi:MAG: aspartate carbamoyltransferase, partial [Deltaproteobacteria bacterium]|nr:aspartate carbamoyltransferase [Deltaproteobacteria bacterium]